MRSRVIQGLKPRQSQPSETSPLAQATQHRSWDAAVKRDVYCRRARVSAGSEASRQDSPTSLEDGSLRRGKTTTEELPCAPGLPRQGPADAAQCDGCTSA